jgi:hypothetical protein
MYNDYMNESFTRSLKLPLLIMTLLYLGLLLAGGSKLPVAFNIPRESPGQVVAYMARYGWAIQLGSFYMIVSSIPLALFMMITIGRLRFLGAGAAGETIALLGGIGTPMLLFIAGLTSWSLTRPGIAEATGAVRALQALDFATAGPAFALTLGFFIGGVSLAAGSCNALPRWLTWAGLVLAVACEMAAFTALNFKAGYFIPVGRFGSIVWMMAVALTLPAGLGNVRVRES